MTSHYVRISLVVSSTAEGENEVCDDTSLAPGGGTYRSHVHSFVTPMGFRSSTILFCTDRRLASNRMRSLQANFELVAWTQFADEIDTSAFSESVDATAAEMALNFQNLTATNLGVRVLVTVSDVELTVADASSACSRRGLVLVSTLTLVTAVAFRSVGERLP